MKRWPVLVLLTLAAAVTGCGTTSRDIGKSARVEPYRLPTMERNVGAWLASTRPAPTGGVERVDDWRDPPGPGPERTDRRVLEPGDQLVVFIRPRGIDEAQKVDEEIDDMGAITLPYLGATRVSQMTTSEIEQLVKGLYIRKQIYRDVDVTVIAQEEEYFVTGEVKRPGAFPHTSTSLTLLQALAAAGGPTPFAGSKVTVRRGGKETTYNRRHIVSGRDPDPRILPRDVIKLYE